MLESTHPGACVWRVRCDLRGLHLTEMLNPRMRRCTRQRAPRRSACTGVRPRFSDASSREYARTGDVRDLTIVFPQAPIDAVVEQRGRPNGVVVTRRSTRGLITTSGRDRDSAHRTQIVDIKTTARNSTKRRACDHN